MKIEKQIKGFIRLKDNLTIALSECDLKEIKSKNGKVSESYIFNEEIITKYKWRYIIRCNCGVSKRIRKDHYKEYYRCNKEYLCPSCQQKGIRNNFWSSENPINWTAKPENKEKMKLACKKQVDTKSNFTKEKWDNIYKKIFTVEMRKKLSDNRKNYIKNLKSTNPDKYKTMLEKLNSTKPIKSKAHQLVENQLSDNNISFKSEFRIKGERFYKYDIYIPLYNLLIEINGDKVHANPKKYNAEDVITDQWKTFIAKDRWLYDKEKNIYAEDHNYNTVTIWSSDIFRKYFNIKDYV